MAEEVSPLYEMRESAVNGDWPLVTSNSFSMLGYSQVRYVPTPCSGSD